MRKFIIPIIVLGVFMVIAGSIVLLADNRHKKQVRDDVSTQLGVVYGELELSLSERLSLVDNLVTYVTDNQQVTEERFQTFARGLVSDQTGIRSLQLAPNSIVTYVYPLQGNEAAVGHNLLADPNRRKAVQRAIDNRRFVIAGPVALRQGGVALIGRKPIFLPASGEGSESDQYWGLAIILADLNPLLAEAGILNAPKDIRYAIRGKDGLGSDGDVFFGDSNIFQSDPEIHEVLLPNGSWQLAAFPFGGWPTLSPASLWLWVIGGGLIAFGAGAYAWSFIIAPTRTVRETSGVLDL